MPGPCRLCCVVTSPFITVADRLCGFDDQGNFRMRNFGCATLEQLRGVALFSLSAQVGDDFVRLAPIAHADRYVLLVWVDQSHRVDHAYELRPLVLPVVQGLADARGPGLAFVPLTLAFAEQILAEKSPRRSSREPLR